MTAPVHHYSKQPGCDILRRAPRRPLPRPHSMATRHWSPSNARPRAAPSLSRCPCSPLSPRGQSRRGMTILSLAWPSKMSYVVPPRRSSSTLCHTKTAKQQSRATRHLFSAQSGIRGQGTGTPRDPPRKTEPKRRTKGAPYLRTHKHTRLPLHVVSLYFFFFFHSLFPSGFKVRRNCWNSQIMKNGT